MKIADFEIIDHGVENEQYFQGCGTAYTSFENVATGIGSSLYEAIDDCMDQISTSENIDNIEEIEKEIKDSRDNIEMEISSTDYDENDIDGIYYYVSIRYNLE